jgi:hypothetical protein
MPVFIRPELRMITEKHNAQKHFSAELQSRI